MAKLTPEIFDYIKRLSKFEAKQAVGFVSEKFGIDLSAVTIGRIKNGSVRRPEPKTVNVSDEVKAFVRSREGSGVYSTISKVQIAYDVTLTKANVYAILAEPFIVVEPKVVAPVAKQICAKIDFARISIPSSFGAPQHSREIPKAKPNIVLPDNKQQCETCDALATVDRMRIYNAQHPTGLDVIQIKCTGKAGRQPVKPCPVIRTEVTL